MRSVGVKTEKPVSKTKGEERWHSAKALNPATTAKWSPVISAARSWLSFRRIQRLQHHRRALHNGRCGLSSVFTHGMLTMGLTGKMLTNYVGDARLTKFGVRFTNQVWPGDTLTATAVVTEINKGGDRLVDLEVQTWSGRHDRR